jgi:hypothetical protein
MKWTRRSGGATLIEVIISSGLLLMLMAILTAIYVRCSGVWRKIDHDTTLLRELQVAVRHLERDIAMGHSSGLTIDNQAIAYLSLLDENDSIVTGPLGAPTWQTFVIVYVDAEGKLRRRHVPLSSPAPDPIAFETEFGSTVRGYLTDNPGADRPLIRDAQVTEFSLEPSGLYGALYKLDIEVQDISNASVRDEFKLTTEINLKNG